MQRIGRITTLIVSVLALIGLTHGVVVKGQSPNFTQLKVDDGLPSSVVYGSFEDRNGFIWFATEFGVSRFDGYQFINYTTDDGLSDNVVFDFFEDSQGRIWFYTYNGTPSYYYQGKIYNYSTHPIFRESSRREMISTIFEDIDGTIWIGRMISAILEISTDDSVQIHEIKHPNPKVISLVSPLGNFWDKDSIPYLMTGSNLIEFDRNNHTWKDYNQSLPFDFSAPVFAEQFPGGLLLVRKENMYKIFWEDGKAHIVHLNITPNGMASTSLVKTSEDEYFVGTYKGVYRYRLSTNTWSKPLLETFSVTSTCRDREGNYWFTTLANGILYTPGIEVVHWGQQDGFTSTGVTSLLKEKKSNSIWVGMLDNHMTRFENGAIHRTAITFPDLNRYTGTLNMIWDDDELVLSSSTGISRFNPQTGKQKHLTIPGSLKSVYRNSKGELLACGSIGLYKVTDSLEQIIRGYPGYPSKLGKMIFRDVFEKYMIIEERAYSVLETAPEDYLIGTSLGLIRSTNGVNQRIFKDHPSMQHTIYSMEMGPDSSIWVATHGGGLVCLRGDSILHFSTENGLRSNLCKVVFVEPNGVVWVGSNLGVSCLRPTGSGNHSYHISNFSTLDGLTSDEVNDLFVTKDTLWLASPKGLSCIPLEVFDRNSPPPFIYLDSLTVNNQPRPIGGPLELEHDENNLGINFIGISYQSKKDITYSYRLLGADDSWNVTRNTNVDFLGLSPGDYTLEVFATNFKGIRSAETLQLNIKILQPWWLRWWALALGLGAIILLIYLFINRRYKVLQIRNELQMNAARSEQKALRARIAPHFIYNALNSIQSLISENNRIEALNYTSRFSRLMRKIFEHSLENFISIEEEIETLEIYLKLESLRFKDKFTYKIEVDPELDPSVDMIPSMVLQPILENSIWHGLMHKHEPGQLKVEFHGKGELLLCVIEDNGIGREAAKTFRSKFIDTKRDSGLEVTRGRLETMAKLEAREQEIRMEIIDLYSETKAALGTRVEVWLPLKHIEKES